MAADSPYYDTCDYAFDDHSDIAGHRQNLYADFGLFYQIPRDSGPLYSVTNVIDTYVYRGLKATGEISMSTAAGLYQSLVGFILVMTSNWIVRKVDKDNALF